MKNRPFISSKLFWLCLIVSPFFSYCSHDEHEIIPDQQPVCENYFHHSVFYEKNETGNDSALVYRVFLNNQMAEGSFAVFENAVWMSEKKYHLYLFKKDTQGNRYFDFKYWVHWLSADEVRYYEDFSPDENDIPTQVLVVGENFAINACGAKWEISFPKTRDHVFELLNGDEFPEEMRREENGMIVYEIEKGGQIKKGDYIRGVFKRNKCPIEILMFP
jgi:hypothetical protein